MTDPRDKRIAELEARIDKLVEAIAELARSKPAVVYPVAPYVPYHPYPWPGWGGEWIWYWNTTDHLTSGTVTISAPNVGGMDAQPVTVMSRPSPTMTVTG